MEKRHDTEKHERLNKFNTEVVILIQDKQLQHLSISYDKKLAEDTKNKNSAWFNQSSVYFVCSILLRNTEHTRFKTML